MHTMGSRRALIQIMTENAERGAVDVVSQDLTFGYFCVLGKGYVIMKAIISEFGTLQKVNFAIPSER